MQQTKVVRLRGGCTEHATALEVLVLGDGLVLNELVHNRCVLNVVVGRNVRLSPSVLVRVLHNHGLNDVVNVVVDILTDLLATVDDLVRLGAGLGEVALVVVGTDVGEELGVLLRGSTLLVDVGDGVALRVEKLLRLVLLVVDGDGVELDVVLEGKTKEGRGQLGDDKEGWTAAR